MRLDEFSAHCATSLFGVLHLLLVFNQGKALLLERNRNETPLLLSFGDLAPEDRKSPRDETHRLTTGWDEIRHEIGQIFGALRYFSIFGVLHLLLVFNQGKALLLERNRNETPLLLSFGDLAPEDRKSPRDETHRLTTGWDESETSRRRVGDE